jgi:hypothetical protein
MFSLIIPCDEFISSETINSIIQFHRQTIKPNEIILSSWGKRSDKLDAIVVEHPIQDGDIYNLSKLRNIGACVAKFPDLWFSDLDTVYPSNYGITMEGKTDALRGSNRRDCFNIGDPGKLELSNLGVYYTCSASPFVIGRDKFFEIGGYAMDYKNYGHEDMDIRLKVNCHQFSFEAIHLVPIHKSFATHAWDRAKDTNAQLYNDRRKLDPKKLAVIDRRELEQLKAHF